MRKIYHLAVEATLDVIGGKWKPVILCHLGGQTLRTSELCRLMPEVSQRVLTRQLRELEQDGIVNRKVYNQVPPRVEYSLTDEGKSLRNILLAMSDWGEKRIQREQQNGHEVEILDHNQAGFLQMK
ncbi:helix-turn-helix transcriptional regulator [Limosilactobacillus sp. STM2_1]|uniref:Helix-turn-helix transcriptional regulator n=1 Tax=Limosilactobacillus rudii TaxID=2759755 RepID=A0A7W3UJ95_9LACO|nr:helix-turn-helix domain-containing protein [Limosilactobacillus rudii]MBB1078463.1 helix-turn-helix transcriptional regulator [Limosilactobacillus rudii]MBB1096593.1 helix-turn-helix transcriptional regulator [Limosilactobacillus rudii]MCD7134211.1 helix-turn-helix transcriptional regulator [Limosilactobacillus rudii]